MIRVVNVHLEHVSANMFRAIIFEDEEGFRSVFDIIESRPDAVVSLVRQRERRDAFTWITTVSAPWEWQPGAARRYDVLIQRALSQFREADR